MIARLKKHFVEITPTVLAAASGPFVFNEAGISFPEFNFPHYFILFCYMIGAMAILRSAFTLISKLFTRTKKIDQPTDLPECS